MPQPITPEAVYDLVSVGEPSLSPDGALLAFVRSWVDGEAMETRSRVMVMDLAERGERPFTAGPKDSAPRFAPDGQALAFLRAEGNSPRQLWLIPTTGGEARRVTDLPGGVREFAWSPDASTLVVVSDVDPDRPPPKHDPMKDPRVRVVRRIRYRQDTIGWRGDAHSHLFMVDTDSGAARALTDGDWDDRSPVWSPDGRRIAFISERRDGRDVTPFSEAYVVPAAGGPAECWSEGLWEMGGLTWSPDGGTLAAIASDDPAIGPAWQGAVFVLEPGKAPRRLTPDHVKPAAGFPPVSPPLELRWHPDGVIRFIGDERGESHLYEIPANGGSLRRVAGGGGQFTDVAMDGDGRRAAVVATTPEVPGDLYLVDGSAGTPSRLTEVNAAYLEEHPPAPMERFSLRRGGLDIECRLLCPPDFDPSRRYPLVVDIHGGPHGAFYDAFNLAQQVLATAGYLVLLVNPRGSSTYGSDFAKAVLEDWGGEDYQDIMAAVDEVCSRPYVDAERLGLHGYSYGGYMTAWTVGHTARFRAAVAGAPCIDLASMCGTSDIGVSFGERQWGGLRHEMERVLRERSPITYTASVETPVLLLHGEADVRCPIEQSEQFFVALKRLGREVEFVRFPDSAHSFLRRGHPKMRVEYLARTLAWFDRWLAKSESPGQDVSPSVPSPERDELA